MEHFILDTLQGRLTDTNGESVRLIQAPPQYNAMPCITLDNSAGTHTLDSNKTNITLDNQRVEAIVTQYETDLRIDIWALKETTRQTLIQQINECFMKALSDHYTYCTSYNDGSCQCIVEDPEYEHDKRAIKKQCPTPHNLPYENLWTKHNIDQATFTITPAYDLDELNETEHILRSRIDISFNYTDYYIIGGKTSQNIKNKTEDTTDG